jgi:hypothetical protein
MRKGRSGSFAKADGVIESCRPRRSIVPLQSPREKRMMEVVQQRRGIAAQGIAAQGLSSMALGRFEGPPLLPVHQCGRPAGTPLGEEILGSGRPERGSTTSTPSHGTDAPLP